METKAKRGRPAIEEYNNFVNEKRNQPKQPKRCQTIETPWNDTTIQEVPGSQTTQRSI